jgi:hypothetical protein
MYFVGAILCMWNLIHICLNLNLFRDCLHDQRGHVWGATNDLIYSNQNDGEEGAKATYISKSDNMEEE